MVPYKDSTSRQKGSSQNSGGSKVSRSSSHISSSHKGAIVSFKDNSSSNGISSSHKGDMAPYKGSSSSSHKCSSNHGGSTLSRSSSHASSKHSSDPYDRAVHPKSKSGRAHSDSGSSCSRNSGAMVPYSGESSSPRSYVSRASSSCSRRSGSVVSYSASNCGSQVSDCDCGECNGTVVARNNNQVANVSNDLTIRDASVGELVDEAIRKLGPTGISLATALAPAPALTPAPASLPAPVYIAPPVVYGPSYHSSGYHFSWCDRRHYPLTGWCTC